MTNIACESKLYYVVSSGTCGRIHTHINEWQSGMRLCIMPKLPVHVVQELNVGTVFLSEYYRTQVFMSDQTSLIFL